MATFIQQIAFSPHGTASAGKVGLEFDDLITQLNNTVGSTATPTFASLTLTATSNQLTLGTTRTATITAPTPGSSSRVYTFPDLSGDYSVVGTIGTQTIGGAKTFSSAIAISATSNHLVLSTSSNTLTINANTQATSARTWSIPDISGAGTFAALEGTQTFSGSKTFSSQIISSATSNHLKLATATSNAIISVATIATADRTITIPDPGTNANFVLSEASATINGTKTFGSAVLFANGTISAPNGFSGDTNNGYYYIGTDNWALSANSTKCVDIKATGVAVIGTNTNDDAASGFIGEILTASTLRSAAITLANTTVTNITSVTLTAGDWDVYVAVGMQVTAGTPASTTLEFGTSATSATMPGTDTIAVQNTTGEIRTKLYGKAIADINADDISGTHYSRVKISTSTTYYVVANANHPAGTIKGYGSITARRAR